MRRFCAAPSSALSPTRQAPSSPRNRIGPTTRPACRQARRLTGAIPSPLSGCYDLAVTSTGFKPYAQKGVAISINRVTRVDAAIEVGAVNEQVSVEAPIAVLQTNKADISVSLDTRAMENLPLSGYRNYQSLINLVPGATPARFQNAVTDTPGRALSTNVNGQERGANNTRVDGSATSWSMRHAVVPPSASRVASRRATSMRSRG